MHDLGMSVPCHYHDCFLTPLACDSRHLARHLAIHLAIHLARHLARPSTFSDPLVEVHTMSTQHGQTGDL